MACILLDNKTIEQTEIIDNEIIGLYDFETNGNPFDNLIDRSSPIDFNSGETNIIGEYPWDASDIEFDLNESIDEPKKTINLNIVGNLNIVEACVNSNVSKFVYASSAYVFSQKGGFYGVSKKSSEMIIEEFSRQHNLDYVVIRYGSVYGERADQSNRIYKLLYEALTTNQIIFPGDGKEEREYIHARDAAELSVDVLSEKYTGKRIMLTGVEKFTYMEVLEFIKEMMNDKIKVKYLNDDYKGHYTLTPYSFSPIAGVKLVNNPSVDFGQGVLECLDKIHYEISVKHESNN